MKPLIICSVHALCNITRLELTACNRACAQHGIPMILTSQEYARINASMTMLEVLCHLAASKEQRKGLTASYLDILNDEIWGASIQAHQSVFDTLLHPNGYARPTGFVSDYPMLTTNLVRSAAYLTNATKLGHITTPSDPFNVQSVSAGLEAAAHSLQVECSDVEVLVAHHRDFAAAQSLGMQPRFVEELQPTTKASGLSRTIEVRIPKQIINKVPIPEAVAVLA